ncbi:hypothetical protein IMG5_130540 [Ichthyophthirius multifiliis]|uniref:Transmembrane protein n=1 Tax=Ichthyophthirius multifiliis TaxID=5932 RepID=G0QWA8_ICHMU|nr:hypothetical protein IMG5_130540 [Ichthyophthirius multifiliis]EGR30503.1 hypothetical protein IMG5_130540 [Ichthyophthirius multifiliis]|eukprot:XP_004032090.1 hypothetical protein IMG5_130540 [Ichthyophthirius multifiliis]
MKNNKYHVFNILNKENYIIVQYLLSRSKLLKRKKPYTRFYIIQSKQYPNKIYTINLTKLQPVQNKQNSYHLEQYVQYLYFHVVQQPVIHLLFLFLLRILLKQQSKK